MPFKDPERRKEYDRERQKTEHYRSTVRKYKQTHPVIRTDELREREKIWKANRTDEQRAKQRKHAIEYRRTKWNLVLKHYGGKCECCGEIETMFLTVDHINGGGKEHRKKVGNLQVWLANQGFPDGFRLLCYNCNSGRSRNGGICPHMEKKQ